MACAVHLLKDALDDGCPDERDGLGIPGGNEGGDGSLQLGHAAKGGAADRLLFKFREPALDQVQPAGTGGDEMQHEARMSLEPAAVTRVAMGAVVVEDQMEGFAERELLVESP